MKSVFLICTLLLAHFSVHAQAKLLPADSGMPIHLRDDLDSAYYEYSGMAKWQHKLLLLPQYPEKWENCLFALDSTDVGKAIAGKSTAGVPYSRIRIDSLGEMRSRMKGTYQGFEGVVVVGNTVYFTLEFSEDTCYLLKGRIRSASAGATITLQSLYPIAKPRNAYANAGYESIGYLPGSKAIIVCFEKNSDTAQSSAWLVDTSLQKPPMPLHFAAPMYFRLTDIAAAGNNSFIGINHYYNDYNRRHKEYDYYVGAANSAAAARQMSGVSPETHHYTAVVSLQLAGNKIGWYTRRFIAYGDENWEGIVPFGQGFLMVVDEYPKDGTPRMRYFKWKR